MNKENGLTGYFACSRAGHDNGKVYIIMKEEDEYVYLADGDCKTSAKPKKKNVGYGTWILGFEECI